MLTNIKGEIDRNRVIQADFNTSISSVQRSSRQKINKETQALNDTLEQMNLIDICRAFHPTAEYTFTSSAQGTFLRIDHNRGSKVSLGKFKKIEIISSIFSGHNTMRLEIKYKKKKKTIETQIHDSLNNILLNNQWITEEIRENLKIPRDK